MIRGDCPYGLLVAPLWQAASVLPLAPWSHVCIPGPQAVSHASQLRSLRLDCCPKVSDRGLLELSRITKLRELSVNRCPKLTGGAVAALQRQLVLLRVARPLGGHAGAALPAMEY